MMVLQEVALFLGEGNRKIKIALGIGALYGLLTLFAQEGESNCDPKYKVLFSPSKEHSGCVTISDPHAFKSFTRK